MSVHLLGERLVQRRNYSLNSNMPSLSIIRLMIQTQISSLTSQESPLSIDFRYEITLHYHLTKTSFPSVDFSTKEECIAFDVMFICKASHLVFITSKNHKNNFLFFFPSFLFLFFFARGILHINSCTQWRRG